MDSSIVLHFVHTLCGRFNNFEQAQTEPSKFSHINIFFRPLPWETFRGPWFYSEQSYDYDPWRPYRQGVHHMLVRDEHIEVLNYGISNGLRLAGAGFNPELLHGLQRNDLQPRAGCAMEFRANGDGSYRGGLEPGCRCLVPRDGQLTYLVSEVEFSEHHWLSLDRGFDPTDHSYRWGSEHGALRFTRAERYADQLDVGWLNDESGCSN